MIELTKDLLLPDTEIDAEKVEEDIKLFLNEGVENSYRLGKGDVEEVHMGLGDDFFYVFIMNMTVLVDVKGKKYIDSFLEDFEVPPEPKPEDKIFERFRSNPVNYLIERLLRFKSTHKRPPSYIIMGREMFDILMHWDSQATRYVERSPEKRTFHDIPIAFVEKNRFLDIA